MSNKFCLVSFIGATNYDLVDYILPDRINGQEEKVNTWTAPVAIVKAKDQHWKLGKVILIGTYKSRWDFLAREACPDKVDTYAGSAHWNFDKDENLEALGELVGQLENDLSRAWGFEVRLVCHMPDLTDETVQQVSDVYDGLSEEIRGQENLLIDITHAFRTMPILLFQMMQQHLHEFYDMNVELVYAEKQKDTSVSVFRDMRRYWEISKLTDSLNRFNATFDGFNLGQYLCAEGFNEIGEWVKEFSLLIKNDHIMKILPLMERLDGAINSVVGDDEAPAFVRSSVKILKEIMDSLGDASSPEQVCLNFAELLDTRNLSTQAIVAIDEAIAVRMAIFAARVWGIPEDTFIGDGEFWNNDCRLFATEKDGNCVVMPAYESIPNNGAKWFLRVNILQYDLKKTYARFMDIRNRIAHGAWQNYKDAILELGIRNGKTDYVELAQMIFESIASAEKRSLSIA